MTKFSGFSLEYEWFVVRLYVNDHYYGPAPTTRSSLLCQSISIGARKKKAKIGRQAGKSHFFRTKVLGTGSALRKAVKTLNAIAVKEGYFLKGSEMMITRDEVNKCLSEELTKQGRDGENPDDLSDAERFKLFMGRIVNFNPRTEQEK